MRDATPSATAVRRVRPRPALRDVTRLPVHPVAADEPTTTEPDLSTPPAPDAGPVIAVEHHDAVASIEAQVRQIEALLAAVREGVGSLTRAGLRPEADVDRAVEHSAEHTVDHLPDRTRPPARPARPSAAHPAQAAVERASLLEAVENRAVIEQAKGMLMLKHRCDADSAFGLLVEISRRERRKVREIAGDIVRSGSAPRRVVDVTDAAISSGRVADQVRAH
jgi:hypothetical protein